MFRITVEEVKEVEKLEKEWQKLSDKESGDYGYVQTKNMVLEVSQVYTQELDEIDLVEVINAVNRINKWEAKPPLSVKGDKK